MPTETPATVNVAGVTWNVFSFSALTTTGLLIVADDATKRIEVGGWNVRNIITVASQLFIVREGDPTASTNQFEVRLNGYLQDVMPVSEGFRLRTANGKGLAVKASVATSLTGAIWWRALGL